MSAATLSVEEETVAVASVEANPILGTYKRAPMELVKGEGVELIDSDGKRYLDFASGIAVNALGYGDAGIARAIADAMSTGLIHTSNLYHTAPGEELARALVERSFAFMDLCGFTKFIATNGERPSSVASQRSSTRPPMASPLTFWGMTRHGGSGGSASIR